ncbi:MAG TPA: IS66 family transposase, partial [Proteobacteria bacterium]|nr:IS66 family transposase [Pseudomonadota bacterium]
MTIENIDIQATIEKVQALIRDEEQMPPSADPLRKRQPRKKRNKKPGGQNGRVGVTFERVDDPDIIEDIK